MKKLLAILISGIGLFITLSFNLYASEKPDVFVNMGHTRKDPIISFALGPKNFVSSISNYRLDDKNMIQIKIWDRYTSRLFRNKVLEFKKDELTLLPQVFAFFSEDENFLFIVVDNKDEKKDMLISYDFKNDKTDIHTFIFSELFTQKSKLIKEHIKYFAFKIEDWEVFFSKFNYKPYLPYIMPFGVHDSNYDSSKVSIRFSKVGDLIENAEIKVKNSFKIEPFNLKIRLIPRPVLSPDEKIFLAESEEGNSLILYDIEKYKLTEIKGITPVYQMWILKGPFRDYAITYGYDVEHYIVWNLKNASLEQIGVDAKSLLKFCPYAVKNKEGEYIFTTEVESKEGDLKLQVFKTNNMVLFDKKTGKELAQFILFTDGEWIVITPEGYYNASPNGDKHLNVRIGNKVYGIENYREAFYRPDLVKLALAGKSLEGYKTLADAGTPPVVEIINTPEKTDKEEIKVTVKLTDTGSGIGDIRLYLNETAVLVDSARGIKVTPKAGEKSIFKTYTVKLLNGENIIKAVAFNGDNTMQSNPAVHKVIASISIKKPSMYAVVIGINEYKNPKLTLKYAVADAKLFAETISQIAKPLFEKVEVKLLTTKEETTKDNIKKTLEDYKKLNSEDVFVFYVASHGTVDEGEYFLITSNVGSLSTFKLKEDALTQAELKELIANVPSTKKFIVIDTCNAGKLGEALQMAMLTRGMSEETAVKILSKAVGSTIISASTSLQEALEGYQGHGLFTYVLVEGMKGRADTDRDGFIKTLELASYVDSEVPALAEKIFKRAQYPTATPIGQSFPLGKIR